MSTLIERIKAEIDKDVRLANGEDEQAHNERHWPDRIERQAAALRKILDEHNLQQKIGSTMHGQELLYYCPSCGGRDWDLDSVGTKPCPTVLALAELYEIEVDTRRFAARRIWGQDDHGNRVVIGHGEPGLVDEDEP